FAKITLHEVIPILPTFLTPQEDADKEEWNISMCAGAHLTLWPGQLLTQQLMLSYLSSKPASSVSSSQLASVGSSSDGFWVYLQCSQSKHPDTSHKLGAFCVIVHTVTWMLWALEDI
ncbi:hypothetical protein EDD16DRAFT_1485640, partial [Pisolithus croceorrhizus]